MFSPDGSKIAFVSDATNVVDGDTNNSPDVFVKDLTTGAVARVSVNVAGAQGDSFSLTPVFSPDGLSIAFWSNATNLVPGDTNGWSDISVASLVPPPEDPAGYVENAAAVSVNTLPVMVSDVDNPAFAGGSLTAALTAGSHAGDRLTLIVSGTPGTGIEVSGTSVSYNGTAIGTLSGSGTANLSVALNASADAAAVEALAGAVGFSSTSDAPSADPRSVTFTLVDGSGSDNGGADTGNFTQTVLVTPVNDAPVTQAATVSTEEDTPYIFQLTDFAFDDPTDAPSPNGLANVIILTLPGHGTLMFDADGAGGNAAAAVTVGQIISVADITAGHLSFVPITGEAGNGHASFDFQVQDDGAGPALHDNSNTSESATISYRRWRSERRPLDRCVQARLLDLRHHHPRFDRHGGHSGNTESRPVFSPDGSKIAFISYASNLVAGDTNGATTYSSRTSSPARSPVSRPTAGGMQGIPAAARSAFSPDGNKIAFESDATNLVAGDTNDTPTSSSRTLRPAPSPASPPMPSAGRATTTASMACSRPMAPKSRL